ncbi:hypothetical protein H5U98_25565 [Mycolicibacterium boenickei]|uniref:Uncharacterized protein n=1 Tax=Mycolicibacterium boenickei TaxID=146017 RepID=A0AAX2ZTU6_9MYCO|nr:hypothetical protein [Mycolicibacterium boenickei]PEG58895.1 hypothetical protein CQY21_20130 [Mycolicibacterium boenickei]UNB98835.1 hypothetical protein H5U98_25565 [Mycolicibacterium boenickei]BBX88399.1 hypothetical protein MBOE_00480 [Mycolicibacterium boenickei]
MRRNTIRTPRQGWEYWRLNRIDDDSLQWLAISLPEARAVIDRSKVWTLILNRRIFLANWVVTEDHHRQEEPGVWAHENIDIDEARDVALEVPQISPEDLARILRPERCLTLDQLDRYPADNILGAHIARLLRRE